MTYSIEDTAQLADLGVAHVVTQGPAGAPIDEVQGFLGTGLADD